MLGRAFNIINKLCFFLFKNYNEDMNERRYSLVIVAGYDNRRWRVRLFPQSKEEQHNFMLHEVQGPLKEADWIHPGLKAKGISTYINADDFCLNLEPNIIVKNEKGKDVAIAGNILLLSNKSGKPEGLTTEEINNIVLSYYPELNKIDACLCYNELAGKLDSKKQLNNIEKDRL